MSAERRGNDWLGAGANTGNLMGADRAKIEPLMVNLKPLSAQVIMVFPNKGILNVVTHRRRHIMSPDCL